MSMSKVAGFDFPNGFDVSSYDQVNERVAKAADPNNATTPWKRNAWFSYAAAWNGVAVRLRSAVEYDEEFAGLIAATTAPPHEERYAQERALFGCVAAALSTVECFYMAAYCAAAALAPTSIPLTAAKHLILRPSEVAAAYRVWEPSDPFTNSLASVASATELRALEDLRNTLAHRGLLPRQHYLSTVSVVPSTVPSNPKALAADFDYKAALGTATTSAHAMWVLNTTSRLVGEFNFFLAARV